MDFIAVSRCVDGLYTGAALNNRKMIDGNYYLVYKDISAHAVNALQNKGITFVNETELGDYVSLKDIKDKLRSEMKCRAAWYYQQFLQIAAGLFMAKADDLVLAGGDLFFCDNYKFCNPAGKKYLNIAPHSHRNWHWVHQKLGAKTVNTNISFVVEHIVTSKKVLEFIARFKALPGDDLECSYKKFVNAVIVAVNDHYEVLTELYSSKGQHPEETMMVDLFSEYQYISLMAMYNFGDEFALRNLSHLRVFPQKSWMADSELNGAYDVFVIEE